MQSAGDCIVSPAKYPNIMFGGLVRYERMHVYFIGYTNYLLELLVDLVPKTKCAQVNNIVQACHLFRDPLSGTALPRLPHILKLTHLTAERRVMAIFYWAHVLGDSYKYFLRTYKIHKLKTLINSL